MRSGFFSKEQHRRVVAKNINPTVALECRLYHLLDLGFLRYVGGHEYRFSAGVAYGLHRCFSASSVNFCNYDGGSFAREAFGNAAANPRARPCDNRYFAFESHLVSLSTLDQKCSIENIRSTLPWRIPCILL